MSETSQKNVHDLELELNWFRQVLDTRMKIYFGQESEIQSIFDLAPPSLDNARSVFARIIEENKMKFPERLCLILALIPYIQPRLLDIFLIKNQQTDRYFTEFGGIVRDFNRGFIPTGETALFLLAGQDLEKRFSFQSMFDADHFFTKKNMLQIAPAKADHTFLETPLRVSENILGLVTTGKRYQPRFSSQFPAQPIRTQLEWKDLILPAHVRQKLKEIENWLHHGPRLMEDWEMGSTLPPGYRALFHGPPGTGKTLAAMLMGKSTGHEVYQINFSMANSKYIGETEKNLARIFDAAQQNQWILFFDEADALFGKRTEVKDTQDRYANQEVAYLWQRIKSFDGVVIMAAHLNQFTNIPFIRNFEAIVHFPLPEAEERLQIWQSGFSPKTRFTADVDLQEIAQKFELSRTSILQAIRYASLEALEKGNTIITKRAIMGGVKRELVKTGKVK